MTAPIKQRVIEALESACTCKSKHPLMPSCHACKLAAELEAMAIVLREPTDEMLWALCKLMGSSCDEGGCHQCPAVENTGNYGPGTRMCRLLAVDSYRAMLSAAEGEK